MNKQPKVQHYRSLLRPPVLRRQVGGFYGPVRQEQPMEQTERRCSTEALNNLSNAYIVSHKVKV